MLLNIYVKYRKPNREVVEFNKQINVSESEFRDYILLTVPRLRLENACSGIICIDDRCDKTVSDISIVWHVLRKLGLFSTRYRVLGNCYVFTKSRTVVEPCSDCYRIYIYKSDRAFKSRFT